MNNAINIILLLTIIFYSFNDIRKSIVIYTISVYIAPVFLLGSIRLSFDIVGFIVLFICYVINNHFVIHLNKSFKRFFLYFIIYCVLTFTTGAIFKGSFSVATCYAIFRFILTILIIQNGWGNDIVSFIDSVLSIVLPIEFVCSVLQMTNIVSVDFFYTLYYKESLAPLAGQLRMGYFNRAYGTTGSPIIIGGFAALSFTFYLYSYLQGNEQIRMKLLKIVFCVMCGLLALSKSAILAIPAATIFLFVIFASKTNAKTILKVVTFVGGITILVYYGAYWLEKNGYAVTYYLSFLRDPFSALNTRYGVDSGNLSNAIDTIKNNVIIGIGNANLNGSFVGDSVYIVILYETGIIGLIAYFSPYISATIENIKNKNSLGIALFFVLLLISFGNALQVSYYIVMFAAVILNSNSSGSQVGYD